MNAKKLVTKAISILVIVCLCFYITSCGDSNSNDISKGNMNTSENITNTSEAPIIVTAKKLYADYEANEIAADDIYKDKLIQLTGTVRSINKDFMDDPYLIISAGEFKDIHCSMQNNDELKACRKGQKITIKGIGGTMIIGTPSIEKCTIQK